MPKCPVFSLCICIAVIVYSQCHDTEQRRFLIPTKHSITPKTPHNATQLYISNSSLTFQKRQFYLDGKAFRILGGSIHYFRIFPEYWRDSLLKLKACGLNTVTIYVPWNLHETYPGKFDFDGRLDLRRFILLAHELGLYVSFRPGPYICAEWEFGGFPSWLLKDRNMTVRSNYPGYIHAVQRYYTRLLQEVVDLQHSHGGPIIAVQVENEFGSYSDQVEHLAYLKQLLQRLGVVEMFFTSDGYVTDDLTGLERAPFYNEALPTVNYQDLHEGYALFLKILMLSEDFPLMVTEFWSGWFDYWGRDHHTTPVDVFSNTLRSILADGASVNFYVFHGGTNFGFTSGANMETDGYHSDVTSYDYDALLTEDGQLTPKYFAARKLIRAMALSVEDSAILPEPPTTNRTGYLGSMTIPVDTYTGLDQLLSSVQNPVSSVSPVGMEELLWTDTGYGQNFGYIYYSTNVNSGGNLTFTSTPTDRNEVYVDGMSVALMDVHDTNLTVTLPPVSSHKQGMELGILVENRGRVNYARMPDNFLNEQRKGLTSDVLLNGKAITNWTIYPMDFSNTFIQRVLSNGTWTSVVNTSTTAPALYRAHFNITGDTGSTFLWMEGWCKGFAMVNGFNLGRYWDLGPLRTLYVPKPLLKLGGNEVRRKYLSGVPIDSTYTYTSGYYDETGRTACWCVMPHRPPGSFRAKQLCFNEEIMKHKEQGHERSENTGANQE